MRILLAAALTALAVAAHAEPGADALFRELYIKTCIERTADIAEFRARASVLSRSPNADQNNVSIISTAEDTAGIAAREAARANSYKYCVDTKRPLKEMEIIYNHVKKESEEALTALKHLSRQVYGKPQSIK